MSFLDRIAECNVFDPARVLPFTVAGTRVGWVRRELAPRLQAFADALDVSAAEIALRPYLTTFTERGAAMERVLRALEREGIVKGWRNESYPVTTDFSAPPLFQMERAGVPHFGVRAFGVHMNGYVRRADGLHMWIGRRAREIGRAHV